MQNVDGQSERRVHAYELSEVAVLIRARIAELGIPNKVIMQKAGFSGSLNILSMIRNGATMLPFSRVPGMADALGIDRGHLMRLTIAQHFPPEEYPEIQELANSVLSANEKEILEFISQSTGGEIDTLTSDQERAIAEAFC